MADADGEREGDFDLPHCIALLKSVRDKCDAAKKTLAAIHITQAIEVLEAQQDQVNQR